MSEYKPYIDENGRLYLFSLCDGTLIFLQQLFHGNVFTNRSIVSDFDIAGRQDGIDILIQSVLRQSVIGDSIS